MKGVVRERVVPAILLLALATLAFLSFYLALHRIYQVDEAQTVYMSRVLGLHRWADYLTTAPLFLLGPLSAIAAHGKTSAGILEAHRLAFLGLFWLNAVLLAVAAGARRADLRGLTIFLFAATFAPLWDYGFEVRHDNVLLTGLLAIWLLGRRPGRISAAWRYALIGAIPVLLEFSAFKSFLYVAPLVGLLLLAPNPALGISRLRALGAAAGGGVTALAATVLLYLGTGTWPVIVGHFRGSASAARRAVRFSAWPTLERLVPQAPILLVAVALVLIILVLEFLKKPLDLFSWKTPLPELLFLAGSLAVLFLNPAPYPYNLLFVVPPAFLLVASAWSLIERRFVAATTPALGALLLVSLGLVHGGVFVSNTLRHLRYDNARQMKLVTEAEALTDPVRDRVYDAAGLVVTRESIGYFFFLHSLLLPQYREGSLPSVRSMLEAHPASVILPSYRTTWLGEADQDFIRSHYLAVSGDLLVLGTQVRETGIWRCSHTGRYVLLTDPSDALARVRVDGQPADRRPRLFDEGPHDVEAPPGAVLQIAWVGPTLDRLPDLGPGSALRTFINFY